MRELLDGGMLHGDCLTVTGKTVAENIGSAPRLSELKQVETFETNFITFACLPWPVYVVSGGEGHVCICLCECVGLFTSLCCFECQGFASVIEGVTQLGCQNYMYDRPVYDHTFFQ